MFLLKGLPILFVTLGIPVAAPTELVYRIVRLCDLTVASPLEVLMLLTAYCDAQLTVHHNW